MPVHRGRSAGFSVIELMITLAVLTILVVAAVPSFTQLVRNYRQTALVNELVGNVMLARAEAAKRGQPITLCGITSGGGNTCAGGTTWDYGWIVFVDVNGNGAVDTNAVVGGVTYDESTMLMRRFRNDYPSTTVRSDTGGATTGAIVMQPFNQSSTAGSLRICDPRGAAKARAVCVSSSGSARSSEIDCAGGTLTCP